MKTLPTASDAGTPPSARSPWWAWLAPGVDNEWRTPDGRLRESWRTLLATLPESTEGRAAALNQLALQLEQQMRADAVSHNVFASDGGAGRPWTPELLPLVIEPADWRRIERGVAQRAQLLEALLADLYGPQTLLHKGLLPPALLFRHPGYLRSLHGLQPPLGLHLNVVAFDLARGPDGRWWVLGQRTRTPAGLGHLLHHRLLVSRLLPEAFDALRVQHVASTYRQLLDTLKAQAGAVAGGGKPYLALLTPGPGSEAYFEHAYLARYLGLPLVEGGDLTVRGERLFLKTLEGLQPVHGLLRYVDDLDCDPLELRPDSYLGVTGLVQVLRAGGVALSNTLGSGFLESPGLQGFLPGMAETLLKEPLSLPSLASWWCGEDAAWEAVQSQQASRLMRPSFAEAAAGVRPDAQRIAADPQAWTLQQHPGRSRALLWRKGHMQCTPVGLRVYAVADARGHWQVLPGGMAWTTEGASEEPLQPLRGRALDLWVRTEGEVDTFSMLTRRLTVDDVIARHGPVPSRTAESLYWLGRHTERCEQLLRLVRASLLQLGGKVPEAVQRALVLLARHTELIEDSAEPDRQALRRELLAGLGASARGIGGQLQTLSFLAGTLRERLAPEQWGVVRSMGEDFHRNLQVRSPGEPAMPSTVTALRALDHLAVQLAAVTGAQSDRMTRDQGWRFLTVGRFIERLLSQSMHFAALLETQALSHAEGVHLLLALYDSTITFRTRYQRHEDLLALVDLLVLDDTNPRAWACIVRRLRNELGKLPLTEAELAQWLAGLPAQGSGLRLEALRNMEDEVLRERLAALASELSRAGARLSDELGRRFFAHVGGEMRSI